MRKFKVFKLPELLFELYVSFYHGMMIALLHGTFFNRISTSSAANVALTITTFASVSGSRLEFFRL